MKSAIHKDVIVNASLEQVWHAWTTEEGARTFFAPEARIDAEVGGTYELYFDLEQPEGMRGSEGCSVVELEPSRRLVVTWNNPPSLMPIRDAKTRVSVEINSVDGKRTRVLITHTGWKEGEFWEKSFAYFQRAWNVVLGRLKHRFAQGPIDWDNPYTPES